MGRGKTQINGRWTVVKHFLKELIRAGDQWLTLVILATQEAEIRRIPV
jgi:hypothetical protein